MLEAEQEKAKQRIEDQTEDVHGPNSELDLRFWSVVSFDRCLASNLTYAEAEEELSRHLVQGINGLCIVTDQAAARLKKVAK